MSDRSVELSRLAAQDREKRIAKWIRDGFEGDRGDLERWSDRVMWGLFVDVDREAGPLPPVALLETEEMAWALLSLGDYANATVLPVLIDISVRDNFQVPR